MRVLILLLGVCFAAAHAWSASDEVRVTVQWAQEGEASATAPGLMLVPEPPIRKGAALHSAAMAAIQSVNARFVRYLPYCAFPRLAIAELAPPSKGRTSWNFSLIDPDLIAFLQATEGRAPILNFGPIPAWMFKGEESTVYASDPNEPDWPKCGFGRSAGKAELVDPSGQQVATYFARIASWYTRGGFNDELGNYHYSGYKFALPWWGVLSEPDIERALTPEQYTHLYDAIVAAVRGVTPTTKFVGMELASPTPAFVEYFLDRSHHAPGTPIDMVSFNFYAVPEVGQSFESWQYTLFDQLAGLANVMSYVDAARKRFSPTTLIALGELGTNLPEDLFAANGAEPVDSTGLTPPLYWNLAAAFYADAFIELSQRGADVVLASQLIGYPPAMFPSIRMLDLKAGTPLPRLQVLKMLVEHLSSSWILIQTQANSSDIAAQAFRTEQGRKLLLVNKRTRAIDVHIGSDRKISNIESVDECGVMKIPLLESSASYTYRLRPSAVVMITFRN